MKIIIRNYQMFINCCRNLVLLILMTSLLIYNEELFARKLSDTHIERH